MNANHPKHIRVWRFEDAPEELSKGDFDAAHRHLADYALHQKSKRVGHFVSYLFAPPITSTQYRDGGDAKRAALARK